MPRSECPCLNLAIASVHYRQRKLCRLGAQSPPILVGTFSMTALAKPNPFLASLREMFVYKPLQYSLGEKLEY